MFTSILTLESQLVNSRHEVVATFEKDRWASYKPGKKTSIFPHKKRSYIGTLSIHGTGQEATTEEVKQYYQDAAAQTRRTALDDLDHRLTGNKAKEDENINLEGRHKGDLTEEAIAFTCWMVVEAEHRLRYRIFDLLAEVAENIGGG